MKINIIVFLCYFITFNLTSQTRDIEVTYALKLDGTKDKSDLISAFESQKFLLQSSMEESLFYSNVQMSTEETKNDYLAKRYSGANDTYYCNLKTKTGLKQTEAFGSYFLIDISNNSTNWVITKETKRISGFNCFKANKILEIENYKGENKEVSITAWYCPEINISSGPLGYFGLPGLILELQTAKMIYYATTIKINADKNLKIEMPINGKRVTQKEFNSIGKKMIENRKW
ncbi:MAG: GLPGLI family protein [Gelidibacter sp.]